MLKEIDHKFFIELEFEEIAKRRMLRNNREKKDNDFLKIGKQEWETFGEPQKQKAQIILDGNKTIKELSEQILNELQ